MERLPNDVLEKIIDQLDLLSLIMLNASCKSLHENIGYQWKKSKYPIQYLNKIDQTSHHYTNLNSMIDDIVTEILPCSTGVHRLYKEYTTQKYQQFYTLQIHRILKKQTYNYSFIIKKGSKSSIQFIYDPVQETYIGIRNISNDFTVPVLFMFIGCKVLFKLHGYCDVKSFKHLPEWFLKVLLKKSFNGIMWKDITNGFVKV